MPEDETAGPTSGASDPAARERARAMLEQAGLTKPPRDTGSRRLLGLAGLIVVLLVVIIGASLFALNRLERREASTTTTEATTTTTAPVTSTTRAGSGGPPPLTAYATASANGITLRAIGSGGQPLLLQRTSAPTFVTDQTATPVVIYWWNGRCAPCAAENYVVVSALEALGGTFHGLATTTVPGPITTVDLRHATYHGPVVLEATEVDNAYGRPDQRYTAQAGLQYAAYDKRPYTTVAGGYPFLDVGGHYVMVGPGFTSALLAGRTLRQVATALGSPDSAVARAVLGNANELDAAICATLSALSRPMPAACSNPGIADIEARLPSHAPTAVAG